MWSELSYQPKQVWSNKIVCCTYATVHVTLITRQSPNLVFHFFPDFHEFLPILNGPSRFSPLYCDFCSSKLHTQARGLFNLYDGHP